MADPQLIEWIKAQQAQGFTPDQVRQYMYQMGYQKPLVEEAIAEANQPAKRGGNNKILLVTAGVILLIILIVAAVISALLGDYVEAGAIIAIVVLNAVLVIVQERRAEQALAALQELAAPEANILRDGHRITVQAHQLGISRAVAGGIVDRRGVFAGAG